MSLDTRIPKLEALLQRVTSRGVREQTVPVRANAPAAAAPPSARPPASEPRRPNPPYAAPNEGLPSVIIAPAPNSSPPISSVELDADDVIEAAPAPTPSFAHGASRPPPPPPARAPTIAPPPPMPPAAESAESAARAPSTTPPPTQPHAQGEPRLGDADITAGHPVSNVEVELGDEAPVTDEPTPSSSRRPRSEHAAAMDDEEPPAPPHTVPPESGRQVAAMPAPAESGKHSSVPAVGFERAPQSVRPDVTSGRLAASDVASFVGDVPVTRPKTFGELLDNALSL